MKKHLKKLTLASHLSHWLRLCCLQPALLLALCQQFKLLQVEVSAVGLHKRAMFSGKWERILNSE